MRRAVLGISSVLALVANAGTATAEQPREARKLEPTSKWVLGYYDERCTLLQNFGSGDDSVQLQIDSFGSWTGFRLTVSGKAVPKSYSPTGKGTYRLTGDPQDRDEDWLQGTNDKDMLPAVTFGLAFLPFPERERWDKMSDKEKREQTPQLHGRPEYERSIDTIRIDFRHGPPFELHVGGMDVPLKEMRKCVDDLYKTWGLDPAQQQNITRFAEPLPLTIRRVQQDYPGRQRMNGISAFVPVRLLVSAGGDASSCVVQSPAVNQDFKTAVCSRLAGKYEPALDASGKPIASMFYTSVLYLLQG